MHRFLCAGAVLVDCIFRGDPGSGKAESIGLYPGGDALNEAADLAKLGCDVSLRCRLGLDRTGDLLAAAAEDEGVDLSPTLREPGAQSPVSVLFTDPSGERRSVVSPAHDLTGFDAADMDFSGFGTVTMASLFRPPFAAPEAALRFARRAKAAGAYLFADVKIPRSGVIAIGDFAETLSLLDAVAPNETEGAYYAGTADENGICDFFLSFGVKTVLLKLGRRGCLIATPDERFHVPAYDVKVADAIGAGDAFAAGFLWARSEGACLRDCGEAAAAAAAISLLEPGAIGGLLTAEQVFRWLDHRQSIRLPQLQF